MAELRAYLREGSTDYIGLLTTILTFLLIEVSSPSLGMLAVKDFADGCHSCLGEVLDPGDITCRLRGDSCNINRIPRHGYTRQTPGM